MRQAVIDHLKGTAAVTAVVGQRIYGRQGVLGGVSRDETPEAFDPDGRLLTSIVVVLESRVSRERQDSLGEVSATQTIQVWCASSFGYSDVKAALRAARAALHQTARQEIRLQAVEEQGIRWSDTRWASTSPELHDETLAAPTMFMRFDATITESLT